MKFATKITSAVLGLSLLMGAVAINHSFAPAAYAQTSSAKAVVDQAKTDGFIGERIDGYLAVVKAGVPSPVQNAMNEINIRRKSVYTRLARAQNVSVDVVARLSGEKLTAKAKAGEKIMLDNGAWTSAR